MVTQGLVQLPLHLCGYWLNKRALIVVLLLLCLPNLALAQPFWGKSFPCQNPTGRTYPQLTYDEARAKTVFFGGFDTSMTRGDTLLWDGSSWSKPVLTVNPPARIKHRMVYDSARQVVVLFGGSNNGVFFNDLWEWNGTAWTERTTTIKPAPRDSFDMAYDRARQRVVLFGGFGGAGKQALGDTWEWNGSAWIEGSATAAIPGRNGHVMGYDEARSLTIVFGGFDGNDRLADTWSWNGSTWAPITTAVVPPARNYASMTYDSAKGRLLLFGGLLSGVAYLDDTWALNTAGWSNVSYGASPSPRCCNGAAFDRVRGELIIYGGGSGLGELRQLGDTHLFSERLTRPACSADGTRFELPVAPSPAPTPTPSPTPAPEPSLVVVDTPTPTATPSPSPTTNATEPPSMITGELPPEIPTVVSVTPTVAVTVSIAQTLSPTVAPNGTPSQGGGSFTPVPTSVVPPNGVIPTPTPSSLPVPTGGGDGGVASTGGKGNGGGSGNGNGSGVGVASNGSGSATPQPTATSGSELSPSPRSMRTVRGRVLAPAGAPLAGVYVSGGLLGSVVTDSEGAFALSSRRERTTSLDALVRLSRTGYELTPEAVTLQQLVNGEVMVAAEPTSAAFSACSSSLEIDRKILVDKTVLELYDHLQTLRQAARLGGIEKKAQRMWQPIDGLLVEILTFNAAVPEVFYACEAQSACVTISAAGVTRQLPNLLKKLSGLSANFNKKLRATRLLPKAEHTRIARFQKQSIGVLNRTVRGYPRASAFCSVTTPPSGKILDFP